MQISDLMGQYHQTKTPEPGKITGTKGVENLVSSMSSLTKGNIFEGTVSSMKNGRVTLALSNGQQVSARLDGKITLNVGESMFFQVKSNDGSQIAIRPFVMDGSGANYTLLQALSAAGLPAEPDYLSMVNRMMQEQMPIDRGSLGVMARFVNANPDIDVQTVVQLTKLGIPVTKENALQFENYLNGKQAITAELDSLVEELPKALTREEVPVDVMRSVGREMLSILTENLPEVPQQMAADINEPGTVFEYSMPGKEVMDEIENALPQKSVFPEENASLPAGEIPTETAKSQEAVQIADSSNAALAQHSKEPAAVYGQSAHTLGALLNDTQLKELNQMLGKIIGTPETAYTKDSGAVEVLKDLQQVLGDRFAMDREPLHNLFSSDSFASLVKDTMEQQWLLSPQEFARKPEVRRLYEKLDGQLERMEHVMKAAGQENTTFAQNVTNVRGNVEFMNQVNQMYTYVQIPLKMSGQNASGELYVYTNKKNLSDPDKELSAFLHLDMQSLGPTDVSVKLLRREVETNFYLENDSAYELIKKNLPVLEAKLEKKGYHCKINVINEAKHVNFVEDFLKKDQPSAGKLHRYSFDMRA